MQLHEVVFHRRGGEQEQKPFLECIDQLPVEGVAVFQVMGLVNDHQVVFPLGDLFKIAFGFGLVDGRQKKRLVPEGRIGFTKIRIVGGWEIISMASAKLPLSTSKLIK